MDMRIRFDKMCDLRHLLESPAKGMADCSLCHPTAEVEHLQFHLVMCRWLDMDDLKTIGSLHYAWMQGQ